MKEFHAFYSEQAAQQYGYAIYETEGGVTKQVTGVYEFKERGEECYKWLDAVYIGRVTKWIGSVNRKEYLNLKVLGLLWKRFIMENVPNTTPGCNTIGDLQQYLATSPHTSHRLVSVLSIDGSYQLVWEYNFK